MTGDEDDIIQLSSSCEQFSHDGPIPSLLRNNHVEGRLEKESKKEKDGQTTGIMNLADLPDDCIATILGHTTPWDATRLAGVSSTFKRAAQSNTLWDNFLPNDYRSITTPEFLDTLTKREIVMSLSDGILLENGMQKYTLLRRSGGVCRKRSVVAMDVAWGKDLRFWRWDPSGSSCFGKVAHLLAVCWLEVTGTWSCTFPPGLYTAVWRLRVANPQGGRFLFLTWKCPLTFTITTSVGQVLEKKLSLSQIPGKWFEEWFEVEVGDFNVVGEKSSVREVQLEYAIREIDCTYWKGGLFLDCLTIRPSGCQEDAQPMADIDRKKIRGHTGVF